MSLHHIAQLIAADLERVEEAIAQHLESDVRFISDIARYVLSSGGKRIRPALLILTARLCNYMGDRVYDLSAVIEFIHTATLLHDDVIDNSPLRRGRPTVNSRWGNEISILLGDYLYAKAMSLSLADKDHLVMQTISDVTMEMAKGQIIETLKQRDLGITEADYFRIISLKTASLFAASCTIGAVLGGVSPQQRSRVAAFGRHLGMAFQMADDTLDFVAPSARLGKPVNNDLKEGKITLPIIMAMRQATPSEVQLIADYLHDGEDSPAAFQRIVDLLHKYGALQSTMAKAREHVTLAKQHLQGFPPSPVLDTLYTLADYVVTRDV
ncbi:MAG: octaprenyl diphosphate synthase [Candidatus Tectimicrobiota bacterium]|nr:MAG: octaprenyl diphosphate synthase [Candidatus Tectomicrobia bacterium]